MSATTPPSIKVLQGLLAALEETNSAEQRKQLRVLATPFIKENITPDLLEDWFHDSPLVGTGSDQVDVRPVPSGLRDALSVKTLAGLVLARGLARLEQEGKVKPGTKGPDNWGPQTFINAIELAITNPGTHSSYSSRSKTGYVFGQHRGHPSVSDMRTWTEETLASLGYPAAPTTTHSATTSTHTEEEDDMNEATTPEAATEVSEIVEAVVSAKEPQPLPTVDESVAKLVNLALNAGGLPPIETIITAHNEMASEMSKVAGRIARLEAEASKVTLGAGSTVDGDGSVPDGKITTAKAKDVFGIKGRGASSFDFDVPVWEWDGPNPLVPQVDPEYIFRPFELLRVLEALITNQRCYLHGHSGTGKTTLIEQVAARLGYMFMRINFDSEITRMDLIGKDVIRTDGKGGTFTEWEDGVLPTAMNMPVILCLDEFDFIRSDVSYVMQRGLEGEGMMVTEDKGRVIQPHPMFRIFATGNTCGQGDEHGMYPGARPQSMALLDRFTMWVKVDYLSENDRMKLIQKAAPDLKPEWQERISNYVTEHLEAFKSARVLQPISPRGFMHLSRLALRYMDRLPNEKKAMREALDAVVLDRTTSQDGAVLRGIVDRVFG